jgi:hypothetical protein
MLNSTVVKPLPSDNGNTVKLNYLYTILESQFHNREVLLISFCYNGVLIIIGIKQLIKGGLPHGGMVTILKG